MIHQNRYLILTKHNLFVGNLEGKDDQFIWFSNARLIDGVPCFSRGDATAVLDLIKNAKFLVSQGYLEGLRSRVIEKGILISRHDIVLMIPTEEEYGQEFLNNCGKEIEKTKELLK